MINVHKDVFIQEIAEFIRPLGLHELRAKRIVNMSSEYIEQPQHIIFKLYSFLRKLLGKAMDIRLRALRY